MLLKSIKYKSRSLWGEAHFLDTQLVLLPSDLPIFPTGRERQSLHMKKPLCEKSMTEASMLKTVKQEVAEILDLRGMTPRASGSNGSELLPATADSKRHKLSTSLISHLKGSIGIEHISN